MRSSPPPPKPGQVAVFGRSARLRTIAALCRRPDGSTYLLTGRDLRAAGAVPDGVHEGVDLLEFVPVPVAADRPAASRTAAPVELAELTSRTVFRTLASGVRQFGLIAGFQPVLRLRVHDEKVKVASLIKVTFDERAMDQTGEPEALDATALGALICLDSGEPLAVLFAASGQTAYGIPLASALKAHGSTLLQIPEIRSEIYGGGLVVGIETMESDLNRHEPIEFGVRPGLELAA